MNPEVKRWATNLVLDLSEHGAFETIFDKDIPKINAALEARGLDFEVMPTGTTFADTILVYTGSDPATLARIEDAPAFSVTARDDLSSHSTTSTGGGDTSEPSPASPATAPAGTTSSKTKSGCGGCSLKRTGGCKQGTTTSRTDRIKMGALARPENE